MIYCFNKITNFIKKIKLEVALRNKIFPQPLSSKKDVLESLIKLKPKKTNYELLRLGPDNDGGYLIPNDIEGISACFAPGVSRESGFEFDLANHGIDIFLADKSVDGPSLQHSKFSFIKKHIGVVNDKNYITLDNWCNVNAPNGDLILQMDIEGAEYEVILSTSINLLQRFRIIIIELHNLHYIWAKTIRNFIDITLKKLTIGHKVVHIHPNNCCGYLLFNGIKIPRIVEVTFMRNDRCSNTNEYTAILPNPLDQPNISTKPELEIPEYWT